MAAQRPRALSLIAEASAACAQLGAAASRRGHYATRDRWVAIANELARLLGESVELAADELGVTPTPALLRDVGLGRRKPTRSRRRVAIFRRGAR